MYKVKINENDIGYLRFLIDEQGNIFVWISDLTNNFNVSFQKIENTITNKLDHSNELKWFTDYNLSCMEDNEKQKLLMHEYEYHMASPIVLIDFAKAVTKDTFFENEKLLNKILELFEVDY